MQRLVTKYLVDLALWVAVTPLAFRLRLAGDWLDYFPEMLILMAAGLPVKIGVIYGLGYFRRTWRKVGVRDLVAILAGVAVVTVYLAAVSFFLPLDYFVPRGIPLIEGMLAVLVLAGMRLAARLFHERREQYAAVEREETKRVLIVGAGEAGTMIAREMQRHPGAGRLPMGFLDDDPLKRRQRFLGLKTLGAIGDLPHVVERHDVDEVLIAIPSAPGDLVRRIVELAQGAEVEHRIIPGIYELLSGQVSISHIREVDVEDLLRREPIQLEMNRIADFIEGKVVLVTGAGGSIGSEIVRQVVRFKPRQVLLLGHDEGSVYAIDREMLETHPGLDHQPVIADVRDRDTLEHVFARYGPEVVFHAAAHKHVPLMEASPDQAVFNNVGGTRNLVNVALEYGVERFVNISTDKAVNPTSVMGVSKRVAEHLVHWAAQQAGSRQAFVSVRFGNVLGSRGSVIPLFKRQIQQGGPVTVTHPDMRRYFMTIPEASQLVLQAASMADNGAVCVLDMGEAVKIMDLARDLISLSGLKPGRDVDIQVVGMRPGEKLYEELLTAEEGTETSQHEKVFMARMNGFAEERLAQMLDGLFAAAATRDAAAIRTAFREIVPSYQHTPAEGEEKKVKAV